MQTDDGKKTRLNCERSLGGKDKKRKWLKEKMISETILKNEEKGISADIAQVQVSEWSGRKS